MEQPYTLLSTRPDKGKTMAQLVKRRLAPTPAAAISPSYTPQDAAESSRNYAIAANMRKMAHVVNTTIMRVVLPHDGHNDVAVRQAQELRQAEWYHQAVMPYYSNFMHTPTDAQRLNNPAQAAAMQQRQMTIPSTYGQFYAFMHAMSAAFGQLT